MSEQTKRFFTGAEVDALLAKSRAEIEARREVIPGPAQGGKVWNPETASKPIKPYSKKAGRIVGSIVITTSLGLFAFAYFLTSVMEKELVVDYSEIRVGGPNLIIAAAVIAVGIVVLLVGLSLIVWPQDAGQYSVLRLDENGMNYIMFLLIAFICFLGTNTVIYFNNSEVPMNAQYASIVQEKIQDETGVIVSTKKALDLANYNKVNSLINRSTFEANGKEYVVITHRNIMSSSIDIFVEEVNSK